jgi:Tol biopolymer transport system component
MANIAKNRQRTRTLISTGCLLGSVLVVAMFTLFAWEIYQQVITTRPLAGDQSADEISADSSLLAPTQQFQAAATLEPLSSGNVVTPNPAESASDPAVEPTAISAEAPTDRIAFASDEGGNFDIFTMRLDGSDKQQLTDSPFGDWRPIWSPDGTKILFHSKQDGNWEIYTMDANGQNKLNITNHPSADRFADWSPDGSKVVFQSDRDVDFDLFVVNADGSDLQKITPTKADEYGPRWSPDGNKIAFDRETGDGREIFVMNADGSGEVQLTNAARGSYYPTWSPDGSKIAFHTNRDDGKYEIYVMNGDGSDQQRLTNNDLDDFFAAFSADGQWVLYHTNITGGEQGNRNIIMTSLDGMLEREVTSAESEERMPAWQPNQ